MVGQQLKFWVNFRKKKHEFIQNLLSEEGETWQQQ